MSQHVEALLWPYLYWQPGLNTLEVASYINN